MNTQKALLNFMRFSKEQKMHVTENLITLRDNYNHHCMHIKNELFMQIAFNLLPVTRPVLSLFSSSRKAKLACNF